MGQIGNPETSVTSYQPKLRNILEQQRPRPHSGKSLVSNHPLMTSYWQSDAAALTIKSIFAALRGKRYADVHVSKRTNIETDLIIP
jgi:hypothetical protein